MNGNVYDQKSLNGLIMLNSLCECPLTMMRLWPVNQSVNCPEMTDVELRTAKRSVLETRRPGNKQTLFLIRTFHYLLFHFQTFLIGIDHFDIKLLLNFKAEN